MPVYVSTLTEQVKSKMNLHKLNFILFASLFAASLFCTADKNEALVLTTSSSWSYVFIADKILFKNKTLVLNHVSSNLTESEVSSLPVTNWDQIVRVHSGKVLALLKFFRCCFSH